jgi:SpoIIAA-like
MPVQLNLHENNRVMSYKFVEPWTMEDLLQLNESAEQHYDSVSHKVHVLFDARGIRNVPAGIMRARSNPDVTHHNAGQIAIVGANTLVRTIAGIVQKLANIERARFFNTEEEAWAYIRGVLEEETTQPSR